MPELQGPELSEKLLSVPDGMGGLRHAIVAFHLFLVEFYSFMAVLECPELPKIVGAAADEIFVLEAFNLMGFNGNDVVDVLKAAGDEEKWFLGNDQAELLE